MRTADLSRLSTFIAVAERGSFARAAAALGRTTSTVSHAVKALEDELQLRLLNRTTRSVTLTEAGERLLTRVRPILGELTEALSSLDDFRDEPRGRLRLSVSSMGLEMVVARILAPFAAAYPEVSLEAVVDNETGDLALGEDAGVRGLALIPQDMITVRLSPPGRQVAVASPEYLRRHGAPRTPADLARHKCIQFRFSSGAAYRWEFRIDGRRSDVMVPAAIATDSMDVVLRAALDGVGVAYTNEAHARPHIEAGRLKLVLESYALPFEGWHLYYPSRRNMTGPLRAFAEFVRRPDVLALIAGQPDRSTPSNAPRERRPVPVSAVRL
ncbi:LysR family transcriptional regulator [Phenylobacterium sp.]|uniref:LysR family transcriptional regulator n=1 Tax=Phenylobacterium sp. TaxID=1871053 RepID=UPI0025F6FECF|nr:LysR family transcriptional regulator [Phenylobacterium sp.]MBX3485903.1 LysR family transcriptional regulator [Phenylobacterium sp.]MCW5758220.1 LysR family transcriptional regulator [Phenylobacterium sp.]